MPDFILIKEMTNLFSQNTLLICHVHPNLNFPQLLILTYYIWYYTWNMLNFIVDFTTQLCFLLNQPTPFLSERHKKYIIVMLVIKIAKTGSLTFVSSVILTSRMCFCLAHSCWKLSTTRIHPHLKSDPIICEVCSNESEYINNVYSMLRYHGNHVLILLSDFSLNWFPRRLFAKHLPMHWSKLPNNPSS